MSPPRSCLSGEYSVFRAVTIAVVVAPAVACLEALILMLVIGVLLVHPPLTDLLSMLAMAPAALVLAYFFGFVPAILGALLMYPVVRFRLPMVMEYIAAAAVGAVVVQIVASGFNPAVLLRSPGFGAFGIVPAVVALYVFRRKTRQHSEDRPQATWKRRQPL